MTKRTRIYTRTGDDGTTGLVGGQRVLKTAPRIESFGTIDELSSAIGLARADLQDSQSERGRRLDAWLAWVQNMLFNIGTELATLPADRWETMPLVAAADVLALERGIDEADGQLAPLATFILPSGSRAGAALHLARTICRRSERLVLALAAEEAISPFIAHWLNRLSDALFVWARWTNDDAGRPDTSWDVKAAPPAVSGE